MSKPLQFLFDFDEVTSFAEEDFIKSPANSNALAYLESWRNWGDGPYARMLLLYGRRNAGKTHLAHIFQSYTNAHFISTKDLFTKTASEIALSCEALIVEDLEMIMECETTIFHLINEVNSRGNYMLITSRLGPTELTFQLADLKSRILAMPSVKIGEPDDELIRTLLIKRFTDRQMRVSYDIINYLAIRVERSFSAIDYLIECIDKKALAEKRKISISLVKEVLDYIATIKNV